METKETASGPVVDRGAMAPTRRWLLGRAPVLLGAPGALAVACGQAAR